MKERKGQLNQKIKRFKRIIEEKKAKSRSHLYKVNKKSKDEMNIALTSQLANYDLSVSLIYVPFLFIIVL